MALSTTLQQVLGQYGAPINKVPVPMIGCNETQFAKLSKAWYEGKIILKQARTYRTLMLNQGPWGKLSEADSKLIEKRYFGHDLSRERQANISNVFEIAYEEWTRIVFVCTNVAGIAETHPNRYSHTIFVHLDFVGQRDNKTVFEAGIGSTETMKCQGSAFVHEMMHLVHKMELPPWRYVNAPEPIIDNDNPWCVQGGGDEQNCRYGRHHAQLLAIYDPETDSKHADNYVFYAMELVLGRAYGLPPEIII